MTVRRNALVAVFLLVGFIYCVNFQTAVIPTGTWVPLGRVQFEETPSVPFTEAVTSASDYVDARQSCTYGTTATDPPSGMGNADAASTDMTEGSFVENQYTTKDGPHAMSTFPPTGWSASGFAQSATGGNPTFYARAGAGGSDTLTSKAIDLSGYTGVRWTWDSKDFTTVDDFWEDGDFYIETYTGSWVSQWSNVGYWETWTNTQDSQVTSYAAWQVRFVFAGSTDEFCGIDNILIEAYVAVTYYRFEAVFRFDSIAHTTYTTEKLYIDFDATSSAENLVWYGGTTSNPSTVIKASSAGNADFNVDISATLTGTPYYVRIVDAVRSGDSDGDTWLVDQCYVYLENQIPTDDGTPASDSKYDTNRLYAHKSPHAGNFAYITTYYSDADGYADINYAYIEGWTGSALWKVSYTRPTDTYAIMSGSSYIAIEDGTESASGPDFDITWHIEIDWDHPDTVNMDIKCSVYDTVGGNDLDIYDVNWDVETQVEHQTGPTLSLSDRCNPSASLTLTGDWQYLDSDTDHVAPDAAETDVYIQVTPSGDTASTNVGADGTYSGVVSVGATVQLETATAYLREQGTTSNIGSAGDSVQVDQVQIHSTGYVDQYVNAGVDSAVLYCKLRYESDLTAITSLVSFAVSDYGTPRTFTYDTGDARWEVTIPTKSTPNPYGFNDESVETNEGVTSIDIEYGWTVYWLRIRILTTTSDVSYANYGGSAQVRVSADLEGLTHSLGSGDTLYVNDGSGDSLMTWNAGSGWFEKDYTKSSIGLFTFTVSTSNANEATYGITVVYLNGKSVGITWDRTRVVSYTVVTPAGVARVAIGDTVTIDVEVHFDSDESDVATGTLTVNGHSATYQSAGKWRFTDIEAAMIGVLYNNMQSSSNARGLTVEDNTVTVTEVWDRVLLTIMANCSWTVVDYYIQVTATGIYDYDDTTWTGSVTWTAPYYTSSSVALVTYGAERVVSISSNEYPYVDAFSVVTSDTVVFDDIGLSSVAYWWTQYSPFQVWLVFEVGSIYWQYNSSDVNNSPQTKLQSYINGTADDWARAYDGTIGSMLIGSFNPQWWFGNISINAEITVSGAFYNWTVWNDVLRVDILHSIHLDDSVVYLTDQYVTMGFQTNWGNASIIVWDQFIDNTTPVFYSPAEGWFHIPLSDVVGTHNLTILINGSHSGASWTGNTQDWSVDTERYSWAWRQFPYVVSPIVTTYETKLVILDTLGSVLDFSRFEIFRNGTRLYWSECVTYSSHAYNITVKDRWGETLNSTTFPSGDYEFLLIVQVYTLKVMSWHHDFVYLNLTHGGLTYREVIAPMETVPFELFVGSYSWKIDYRNGSVVSGNINLVDSTALIVTGSTIADLAGYSSTLLAMTTSINVTVTNTNNQIITISIDLTNVNTTIYNQTVSILTNLANYNTTVYDQTIQILADLSNMNSTLYSQTVSILANLQNVNATLYAQTVTLLADVQNMNTTLYSQTVSVLAEIQNANMTLYNQTLSILTYILNTNSTLYSQTISLLYEVDTIEEQAEVIEGVARTINANLPESPPDTEEVATDIWSLILKVLAGFVIVLIFAIILSTVIRALLNDRRLKAPGGKEQNATSNPVIYS